MFLQSRAANQIAVIKSLFGIIRFQDQLLALNDLVTDVMGKTIHSAEHQALRELLVSARKKAGLTQAQVAEKLGRPQSFVAKYESGERRLDVVEFVRIMAVTGHEPTRAFRQLWARIVG